MSEVGKIRALCKCETTLYCNAGDANQGNAQDIHNALHAVHLHRNMLKIWEVSVGEHHRLSRTVLT